MKLLCWFVLVLLLLSPACALVRIPDKSPTPTPNQERVTATIAGLKPADSDTPAAGICGEPKDEIVRIVLGSGPDGLPLAGRCLIIHPDQRLKLANGTGSQLSLDFAQFHMDLSAGEEMLLDRPVGEYLALGVHFLPLGPELWVKEP
jgi:hypothetical protein